MRLALDLDHAALIAIRVRLQEHTAWTVLQELLEHGWEAGDGGTEDEAGGGSDPDEGAV